jgi:hypothetical protein
MVGSTSGGNPLAISSNLIYNPATGVMQFPSLPIGPTAVASSSGQLVNYDSFTNIGSWTPILTPVSGSFTQSNSGQYIKIGNLCFVQGSITLSSISGGTSGNLRIAGLPFTSSATTPGSLSVGFFNNIAGLSVSLPISLFLRIDTNDTIIRIFFRSQSSTTTTTQITANQISSAFTMQFSGFYITS